jgi:hypothetical protein
VEQALVQTVVCRTAQGILNNLAAGKLRVDEMPGTYLSCSHSLDSIPTKIDTKTNWHSLIKHQTKATPLEMRYATKPVRTGLGSLSQWKAQKIDPRDVTCNKSNKANQASLFYWAKIERSIQTIDPRNSMCNKTCATHGRASLPQVVLSYPDTPKQIQRYIPNV